MRPHEYRGKTCEQRDAPFRLPREPRNRHDPVVSVEAVLAIIDDQERLPIDRRLPNDLAAMLRALEPFRDCK